MENIKNEEDAIKACSEIFTKRSNEEMGLKVHHVKVTPREESCMGVATQSGGHKTVPILDVYFRGESFKKVTDERKQLTDENSEKLRKLWQETTIPYGEYIDRKEYCDSKMYIHAFHFEQRCFFEYIDNRKDEISNLLNKILGVKPTKINLALEGINIVFSTADYMRLGIDAKAESLKESIIAMAEKYIAEKYQEKVVITSYIKFWHPEMPGYNGYHMWL